MIEKIISIANIYKKYKKTIIITVEMTKMCKKCKNSILTLHFRCKIAKDLQLFIKFNAQNSQMNNVKYFPLYLLIDVYLCIFFYSTQQPNLFFLLLYVCVSKCLVTLVPQKRQQRKSCVNNCGKQRCEQQLYMCKIYYTLNVYNIFSIYLMSSTNIKNVYL